MNQLVDYIEMKIPAKPEFVGIVRLTLSGIASRMGYSYDEIEDLKIATSEACTNAVQHAYKNVQNGEVTIGYALYPDRLEVIVSDKGESFNFEQKKSELGPYSSNSSVDSLSEGGLGLYLMEALMDEVRVQIDSGVTVYLTKLLNGERVKNDTAVTNYEAN